MKQKVFGEICPPAQTLDVDHRSKPRTSGRTFHGGIHLRWTYEHSLVDALEHLLFKCSMISGNNLLSGWWFDRNIWIIFPYIGNVIIPTDELIFFRGVGQPPPSYEHWDAIGATRPCARDLFFGLWVPDLFMKRALETSCESNLKTAKQRIFGEMNLL